MYLEYKSLEDVVYKSIWETWHLFLDVTFNGKTM